LTPNNLVLGPLWGTPSNEWISPLNNVGSNLLKAGDTAG
jgi:hypothetical protein